MGTGHYRFVGGVRVARIAVFWHPMRTDRFDSVGTSDPGTNRPKDAPFSSDIGVVIRRIGRVDDQSILVDAKTFDRLGFSHTAMGRVGIMREVRPMSVRRPTECFVL